MKTSPKQISLFTEEELTSSQEAFHVSRTAWPENEKAKPMNAIYGQRCLEQYERLPQSTSLGKTFLALLIGTGDWYSTRCILTWSLRVTRSRPWLYLRRRSMHRTEGTGFGLLLKTPCTADAYSENLAKKEQVFGNSGTLAQEIQSGFVEKRWPGLLPTPNSRDEKNGGKLTDGRIQRKIKQGYTIELNDLATMGMLPTPQAQEGEKITGNENQDSMTKRVRQMTGKTSQLNPLFVNEMMGFPINYLNLW